jgi:adenosylcobinamide-phosphate synthase
MVGYRSARYARFGWAAARADDVANLVPARLTAALVAALSGRPREVLAITRRYAARHPSPNAGWCEAAFAAALGVRLGGENRYGGRVEARPLLGDGRPAEPGDIARATALARRVRVAATLIAAACVGGLTARPGAAPRGG